MAEYIERDMFLKIISHKPSIPITDREDRLIDGFISAVKNCPAADVRPVARGRWKIQGGGFVKCTSCMTLMFNADTPHEWNFCPNCGADMRGEQDV